MASAFDWLSFLWEYSREILADSDERAQEDGRAGDTVPPEVRASGWLGYPGATEAQIAAAEARLGVTLPPSYRAFLRVSNGWRPAGGNRGLWSSEEIEWYAVEHQCIDRWEEAPDEVPNELYFDYGPDQDPIYVRLEYLQDALQIGPEDEWDDVDVLIPRVVTADGEWQAWNKGRDLPGAYRSRSFREMLAGNDPGIHEQRLLDHRRPRRVRRSSCHLTLRRIRGIMNLYL